MKETIIVFLLLLIAFALGFLVANYFNKKARRKENAEEALKDGKIFQCMKEIAHGCLEEKDSSSIQELEGSLKHFSMMNYHVWELLKSEFSEKEIKKLEDKWKINTPPKE